MAHAKDIAITSFFVLVAACGESGLEEPLEGDVCAKKSMGRGVPAVSAGTATVLDSGDVLVAGGYILAEESGVPVLQYTRLVSLYQRSECTFIDAGELRSGAARANHTATLLPDGRVFIANGEAHVQLSLEALASAFTVDDPSSIGGDTLRMTPRTRGFAALDGGVLLVGGGVVYAETGDAPVLAVDRLDTATMALLGEFNLPHARRGGFAAAKNGRLFLAGGDAPAIDLIQSTGEPIAEAMSELDAARIKGVDLGDERVLLTDGDRAEGWSFAGGQLDRFCTADFGEPRSHFTIDRLGSRIVIAGGYGATGASSTLVDVGRLSESTGGDCWSAAVEHKSMSIARAEHLAIAHASEILYFGGTNKGFTQTRGSTTDTWERIAVVAD